MFLQPNLRKRLLISLSVLCVFVLKKKTLLINKILSPHLVYAFIYFINNQHLNPVQNELLSSNQNYFPVNYFIKKLLILLAQCHPNKLPFHVGLPVFGGKYFYISIPRISSKIQNFSSSNYCTDEPKEFNSLQVSLFKITYKNSLIEKNKKLY